MNFKHLLALTLLGGCLSASQATTYMTIELKSGKTIDFALSDKPVITYNESQLVVNGKSSTSYAFADVKEYRFTEGTQGSVKSEIVSGDAPVLFYVEEDIVNIKNAKASEKIALFSVNGITLALVEANAEGEATLQLPSAKGVYVLTIGTLSFKIVRK